MLSYQEQEIVLKPILIKDCNKFCADCGTNSPTWASLDFGVLVCSNCSGSHRAMGPTITRIKSTKLDQWNRQWLNSLVLGNVRVNEYWEADSQNAKSKKPGVGASLDQHNRYVFDKYLKKKFVVNKAELDPLKAYRIGKTATITGSIVTESTTIPTITSTQAKNSLNPQAQASNVSKPSLLDDQPIYSVTKAGSQKYVGNYHVNQDDNDFTDYVEPVNTCSPPQLQQSLSQPSPSTQHSVQNYHVHQNPPYNQHSHQQHQAQNKNPSGVSFDDLLKSTKQQTAPRQTLQNFHPQMHYQNPQNNLGYMNYPQINNQNHHHPQQGGYHVNQFAHNPYIGYAAHNPLHAAYNMQYKPY